MSPFPARRASIEIVYAERRSSVARGKALFTRPTFQQIVTNPSVRLFQQLKSALNVCISHKERILVSLQLLKDDLHESLTVELERSFRDDRKNTNAVIGPLKLSLDDFDLLQDVAALRRGVSLFVLPILTNEFFSDGFYFIRVVQDNDERRRRS